MTDTTTKLPEKISDLIELAVNDMNIVAEMPGYKLDMDHWHKYSNMNDAGNFQS